MLADPEVNPKYISVINDMMIESKTDNALLSFQKFKPQKQLEKFIEYFWISKSNDPVSLSARIIQDGSADILFLFDAEYEIKINRSGFGKISNAQFIGGRKCSMHFAQRGLIHVIGARFRPGGFYPFLKISAKEIAAGYINLENLFGNEIFELEERLYNSKDSKHKINLLESFLLRRISQNIDETPLLGLQMAETIRANKESSIDQLKQNTGYYYKKIERIFLEEIGFTPKYFTRIVRFQNVLRAVHNKNFNSFTELAINNSFFDQSHLIKEFEYFTGTTPHSFTRYYNSNTSVI